MKTQKYLPENANDVYDFVLRNVSADSKSLFEIFKSQTKKAKELLGWEATHSLEDMVRSSWNWQKNNPNGYAE